MNEDVQKYVDQAMELIQHHGLNLVGAIIVWVIGGWIIKAVVNAFSKVLKKSKMDPSLQPFLISMAGILLKVMLGLSALGMLGIEMTSFIAILGAAGLAVGMALSGTLQNFAGGVMILLFKPYKVGDLIEAQGHLGVVSEIQIFVTIMSSPQSKTIIIPNGPLANGDVTNYTTSGEIRVDLVMGIAYDADIKTARNALMEVMEAHPKVLKSPAPFVGVLELGDSSVNLAVRPFADPVDYWDVYFDIYEQGKEALDKANITIPFPQMDVHLDKLT